MKKGKKNQKETKKTKNSPIKDLDTKAKVKGGNLKNLPGVMNHNEILI